MLEKFWKYIDRIVAIKSMTELFGAILTFLVSRNLLHSFHVSQEWIAPISMVTAYACLYLISKYFKPRRQLLQGGERQLSDSGNTLSLKLAGLFYSIDPRLTSDLETGIRAQLDGIQPVGDRESFLVRAMVVCVIFTQYEIDWHNLFRSQIEALQELNGKSLRREEIFPKYADATTKNPQFYSGYSFDQWLGYLRSRELIRDDADKLNLTVRGRQFLKFVIDEGRHLSDKAN